PGAARGGDERRDAEAAAELDHAHPVEPLGQGAREREAGGPELGPVRQELVLGERLLVEERLRLRRPPELELDAADPEPVGDQSSRTEWIGTSPAIAAAVAFAVPDGASSFVSWWSSTISARSRCRDASAAKRIISTAPIAKFGATKTGSPAARAGPSTAAGSQPVVPTTQGSPASSARSTFGTAAAGAVKSTIASASASVATRTCPASSSAGPRTAPTLPVSGDGGLCPLSRIFTTRRGRGRARSARAPRRTAPRSGRSRRPRGAPGRAAWPRARRRARPRRPRSRPRLGRA